MPCMGRFVFLGTVCCIRLPVMLRGRHRGKPTKESPWLTRGPKEIGPSWPARPPRVEYRGGEGFCARLEADGSEC